MKSGIYRWANGKKIELSSREVKRFIMQQNNWTSEEYTKKYDIFKNQLRAYEMFKRSQGLDVKKQSPVSILYKQAKAKKSLGASYQPSLEMRLIKSFPSISMGKAGQKALKSNVYIKRRAESFAKASLERFAGLLKHNDGARKIAEEIKDPIKRDKALAKYANFLHTAISKNGKMRYDNIPFNSEVVGSDTDLDWAVTAAIRSVMTDEEYEERKNEE